MNKVKRVGIVLFVISLVGCGYSQRDGEMIGQVKKVVRNTPLICSEFTSADISLGVIRGGIGSMSTQDVWVTILEKSTEDFLRKASETGQLVKLRYDEKRFDICRPEKVVIKVNLVE